MNKVSERCGKDQCAKFYYASRRLFSEVKALKVFLYFLAVIPITMSLIPVFNKDENLSFMYALISFGLTILSEAMSQFLSNHKERAILEFQLYESEITGSTFSKIEYDRESTNMLEELAIRKGLPGMKKAEKYPVAKVPDDISDDYSYIYLTRREASTVNFLLSRVYIFYIVYLTLLITVFVSLASLRFDSILFVRLIIGFYPLIIPIVRNINSCKKCQSNCVKICADIDNFFDDGDGSTERLARFYYYVQNIEFEMMVNKPPIYNITKAMFKNVTNVLSAGVTTRFLEAIEHLKVKSKGLVVAPKGKALITKVDYDYNKLEQNKLKQEKKALEKQVEELTKAVKLQSKSKPANATRSSTTSKVATIKSNKSTKK